MDEALRGPPVVVYKTRVDPLVRSHCPGKPVNNLVERRVLGSRKCIQWHSQKFVIEGVQNRGPIDAGEGGG